MQPAPLRLANIGAAALERQQQSLLEEEKLGQWKRSVHPFKTNTYRDAYAYVLRVITYKVTEHVYTAIPELHYDHCIGERGAPCWPRKLRMIDTKCHHLPLARLLAPGGQ